MGFHLISASVISILFVAAGILAPPAMAQPEYGITYEPKTIYVGDTVTFQAIIPPVESMWATRWIFGDGSILWHRTLVAPHTYSEAHTYTVYFCTWSIMAGKRQWISIKIDIDVLPKPKIPAIIDIDPDTLNLASKGKWITAYIELPDGHDAADIKLSTVLLNENIPTELKPTEIGDHDEDGVADLMVKFSRAGVGASLGAGDEVELTITGELVDGTPFEGSDIIRVIKQRKG